MTAKRMIPETYVSLLVLEKFLAEARSLGARDEDDVVFGELCVDETFIPHGRVLACGWARKQSGGASVLLITKDADVPVLVPPVKGG